MLKNLLLKTVSYFNNTDRPEGSSNGRLYALIIIIMAIVMSYQIYNNNVLESDLNTYKDEVKRVENNFFASQDSIKKYKNENGKLVNEIATYVITTEELNTKYNDLLADYNYEKNKPPKVIIETETVYKDTLIKAEVEQLIDKNGNTYLEVSKKITFDENNYFSVTSKIPYSLLIQNTKDSTIVDTNIFYPTIVTGLASFNIDQKISLQTEVYRDLKDGMFKTKITSAYPLEFKEIKSLYLKDVPLTRKEKRSLRKEWGLGVNVGYGINKNGLSPTISVGLNYTPNWLQW